MSLDESRGLIESSATYTKLSAEIGHAPAQRDILDSLVNLGCATVRELSEDTGRESSAIRETLRALRRRRLAVPQAFRGTPALWAPTAEGQFVMHAYRRKR